MSRSDPLTEPGSQPSKPSAAKSGRAAQIVRRLVAVALLLALASGGALFAMLYTADAEFVAGAMSKLLGLHVEIGRVTFHFGRRIELDLEQLKVADPEHPEGAPVLEVGRASGAQAWPRLLAGQYLPLDWILDAPVLRIHTSATAAFDISTLPRLGLRVTDGTVEVTTAGGELWSLQSLQLDARRAGFGTRVEGEGSARVSRGETPITELALRFSAARDHADLKGTVAALELAALPKAAVAPRGRGEGDFDLSVSQGAVRGKIRLEVERFSLQIPKYSAPIAPAVARVAADVDWKGGSLALELHPLQMDDLVATGSVRVSSARNGRFVADLRLAPFEPARERVSALSFLALRFASWARVKKRIEAGVVEDIRLAVDVPRATLGESLSYESPMAPDAFVLELRARDGRYRPIPDDSPLENLQGELEIRGEVMDIRRMRMTHEGKALPEINVHLDGMHRLVRLPDAEDHVVGGPGVDLDGLGPLGDALRAGEGKAKEPTVVRFSDLAIRLPQFVLPLREAEGSLRFPDGGIDANPVRGVLGGAPAELSAKWSPVTDRVDVDIRYLEGAAPGGPVTGPRWLSAKLEFEQLDLPDWPLGELRARVKAEGAAVTMNGIQARLAGGDLKGTGHLDLSLTDKVPFDLALEVTDFDPKPMCATFSLPAESVTGRGYAKTTLSGALRPGGEFTTEGALETKLILRDGSVAHLPALVAIARLPSLRGVTGLLGTALPYKTVEVDIALANGKLAFSDGKLLGPELRLLGNGEIDFNTPHRQTDFVVALLFLQTLDRMLDQVPIVRNVVLGDDKNLIAVYLRLQGPRDDLTVTPLPPQTVQTIVGFASSAVVNGVKRLGRLIQAGSAADAGAAATPAPSSEKP
jgi:hypothetical protein